MLVHTMTLPELVAEARKDHVAMRNKLDTPLRRARRELIHTKQEILHLLPWRSTHGTNWLLLIHQQKNGARIYSMAWYLDRDGRVNALWVARAGMAFHIDRHVIERYGQRFDPTASPLERLQHFFTENYFYSVEPTVQDEHGNWKVNIGMNHGMGLGLWDQENEIVQVRTFVNHGQLFQHQEADMERMDVERLLFSLTRGQRMAFVAQYKRTYPEELGETALAWLERMAA
jgi:hypothetical protein